MKIAYVTARGDAFGGASLHVCDMARRLASDGHSVRVFVGGNPDMEVPRRLAARNLDFQCIPQMGRAINVKNDFIALRSLRRSIKAFSPDLVSMHASKAGALGRLACAGLGVPLLYTPHCWSFVDEFPKAGLYLWIERILAPLATRIITVCDQERRFGLQRGVGKAATTVCIHNGVVELGLGSEPVERASPNTDKAPRILMVGRFEEQKDHELLLYALADNFDLDWRLTLVGDGPRRTHCQKVARDLKIDSRVNFVGYSDRVEEYLDRSDIFALVTHWEGFPRSILEAMRAGLAVIVSDVGGCSESVIDGETGRVVPQGDRQELAGALRQLITDRERCRLMGARGLEQYQKHFTFENMYQKYVDLYRSVCSR
jgi:glycosyltransferase involved in cell wall biosynthesis